jgi:hypothetical protein
VVVSHLQGETEPVEFDRGEHLLAGDPTV